MFGMEGAASIEERAASPPLWEIRQVSTGKTVALLEAAAHGIATYTVGRMEADIIVNDKGVSRQHAKLSLHTDGSRLVLVDMRSKFGTLVNGRSIGIGVEVSLSDRDELSLGGGYSYGGGLLARKHIGRKPILIELPVELLPHVMHGLEEQTVFRGMPQVCRAIRKALCSAEFMLHRAKLRRAAVPWSTMLGISYVDNTLLESLRPFMPHLASLHSYVQQNHAIDWSGGAELCILTLDTRVWSRGTELFSEMPDACIELHGNTDQFVYDAGPRPSPWLLQIYRAGAPQSGECRRAGKHYGIRTLQEIPEKAFVCAYWGEHRAMRPSEEPGDLRGDNHELCERYVLSVATPAVGGKRFVVDPSCRGNLARWINHSDMPNLAPSLEAVPGQPYGLIVLRSVRRIAVGEELLWDYTGEEEAGILPESVATIPPFQKYVGWDCLAENRVDEMLRTRDGATLAAAWAANMVKHGPARGRQRDFGDTLLVQSLPPNGDSPPEEHQFHKSYDKNLSMSTGEWLQRLPLLTESEKEQRWKSEGWQGEWWPGHTYVKADAR